MSAIFMATFEKIGKKKVDYGISYENKRFGVIKAFNDRLPLKDLNQKHAEIEAIIDNGGRPEDSGWAGIHLYNAVCGTIKMFEATNKKNRIAIILTDGEDTDNDLEKDRVTGKPIPSPRLARKLEEARHAGIEIIGIGFKTRDTEVFDKWVQLDEENAGAVVEALLKIARRKALSGKLPNGNLVNSIGINLNRAGSGQRTSYSLWDRMRDSFRGLSADIENKTAGKDGGSTAGTGGIDLRTLSIIQQPVNASILPALFFAPAGVSVDIEKEWQSIEAMISKGDVPPAQQVKEFWGACSSQGQTARYTSDMLDCIAYMMRAEECQARPSDPELKNILVLVETG
jgi:hypothetical protein